jgi:methionyl-tRNA synthetase
MPEPGGPPQAEPAPPTAPATFSFEDFKRLQLVVGEIKEVADHPNAAKLLLLQVDLGGGQSRQLVAGLKGCCEPAQLVGRQVVVVANLAPAVIRGQKSEGMLLAAEGSGGAPVLLGVERPVPNGAKIR